MLAGILPARLGRDSSDRPALPPLPAQARAEGRTQQTGGTCYVMAKGTGPRDRVIEGTAQYGEINIAEMAKVPIEYVYY